MKISVIIPTYKPQAYIYECLESLINQTFPNCDFEVIIILNGCNEPWNGQITQYVSEKMADMNALLLQTDEAGVSNARNIGIARSRGEFITFIDDDDFVSPDYLNEMYEVSSANVVTISKPKAFIDGVEGYISYKMEDVYKRRSMLGIQSLNSARKFFSGPCMKLIPKRIIQNRQFDIRFRNGEDSLFMFLISDKIDKVNYASDKAIYYRRFRENSAVTTKRTFKERLVNSLSLIKEYSQIFFSALGRYNFIFFITRILGALRSVIN